MTKRRDTTYTLAFSGGGARGYYSINWFNHLVQLWGINESEVYKYFNIITGTSIGGIIALSLAYGHSIQQLTDFFEDEAPWVFTIRSALDVILGSDNATFSSNRPWTEQKIIISSNNDQWYNSISPTSNYGSSRLKTALTELFGTATLQDLSTNVIIPAYNYTKRKPILFSNLNYPEFIGQNESLVNVALCTSAAPIYLPPVKLAGGIPPFVLPTDEIIDGGMYKNNPAHIGYAWSRILKSRAARHCLLSIGTCQENPQLTEEDDPESPPPDPLPFENVVKALYAYFMSSIESTNDDDLLKAESANLLGKLFYCSTNPFLPDNINGDLDNTDSDFLTYLKDLAQQEFNADISNIQIFMGHLTA
jgi:patatin-like phospholipase/acyl hydrolase